MQLSLAQKNDPESRLELIDLISDLYISEKENSGDAASAMVADIFKSLVLCLDHETRVSLAEALSTSETVPVELLRIIAMDDIDDVRRALGYEQVTVHAGEYRVGQGLLAAERQSNPLAGTSQPGVDPDRHPGALGQASGPCPHRRHGPRGVLRRPAGSGRSADHNQSR